jgi:fructokinase
VFGVILGTGVGGGIVVNGRLLTGPNAIAGEWGHNPLPWPAPDELPGPPCYCGKRGCIEVFLSGPALAADYAAATGRAASALEIAAAAVAGESDARAALERYTGRLARALASVIDILDPDAIVLGGGLSNVAGLGPAVRAALPAFVFSDFVDTPVLRALHGDSSGVRGAARLWPSEERA